MIGEIVSHYPIVDGRRLSICLVGERFALPREGKALPYDGKTTFPERNDVVV